jgi:hypothetical protein
MEDFYDIDVSKAYCVAGSESERFLEDMLTAHGLTPTEISDCIG